jgi:KUP system potassium uptake protein
MATPCPARCVMVILASIVAHDYWKWSVWRTALVMMPFQVVDLAFLSANLLKIVEGGWLPFFVGAGLLRLTVTWRRGTSLLADHLPMLERKFPDRAAGTAQRRVPVFQDPDN